MNNARRKDIAKAAELLEEAKGILESALEEEQEYFDNMPESFQNGEKGDTAQAAIDNIEQSVSDLETIISAVEEAAQ